MKKTFIFFVIMIFYLIVFSDMIKLKISEFSTDFDAPDFSYLNLSKSYASDTDYFLIQYNQKIQQWHKNELLLLGIEILDYIPENAYLIKADRKNYEMIKNKPYIKFTQIWQPAYRIEPSILELNEKDIDNSLDIFIELFNNNEM